MKSTFFFVVIASLVLGFACKNTTSVQTSIEDNAINSTWKITKFVDSGKDETSAFSAYSFTFVNTSEVKASNSTTTIAGTWLITDSNSKDDSQDDLHFVLNFPATNNFDNLNEDWNFISQSATKIELTDVSGGNGGTDYLTFEKK